MSLSLDLEGLASASIAGRKSKWVRSSSTDLDTLVGALKFDSARIADNGSGTSKCVSAAGTTGDVPKLRSIMVKVKHFRLDTSRKSNLAYAALPLFEAVWSSISSWWRKVTATLSLLTSLQSVERRQIMKSGRKHT